MRCGWSSPAATRVLSSMFSPEKAPLTAAWVASDAAAAGMDHMLREDVNEAMLFHGTSSAAAEAITRQDFRLKLSGSNAGTLFGRGIYLAECVSKSDEYTEEVAGVRTILVCRATLGRVLYTDAQRPNVGDLEQRCGSFLGTRLNNFE